MNRIALAVFTVSMLCPNALAQAESPLLKINSLTRTRAAGAPMRNKTSFLVLVLACFLPASALAQQSLDALIARELNSLVETYKMLHATPELSHREEKTSTFFAGQLRGLGFTVTERVGKFDRPGLARLWRRSRDEEWRRPYGAFKNRHGCLASL